MNDSYTNYVNISDPPAADPGPAPTWKDAVGPVAAVLLSIVFWQTFCLNAMDTGFGPGLGVLALTAAFYGALFLMLGRRFTADGAFLMAASLLLAVCCTLYAHPGFMVLNCFVILVLSAMATFSLSGQGRWSALDLRAIPEAVRLSVLALCTRIDRPFTCAERLCRKDRGVLLRGLLTVLGTLILLAVVLALLSTADMVFGSFFAGLWDKLAKLSLGSILWRIARCVILALFIASGFCFVREPAPEVRERTKPAREKPASPFLVPALALDVVYIIFCFVQFRHLFGGADAAAMAGGWAAYARTGFFQLSAVAAIDLSFCLIGTDSGRFASKGGPLLRAAYVLLLLLTAVILVSACYRMFLYIAAFGLSVLRLMTLWGMLMIAVGLVLACIKLFRPDFRFWRIFFPLVVTTWCLFCLANPAGRVAAYNVDAYLDGRLQQVDMDYLEELTPDAARALARLRRDMNSYNEYGGEIRSAEKRFEQLAQASCSRWTSWKLSCALILSRTD